MQEITKTCIVCPKGCRLTIKEADKEQKIIKVIGNQCKRGETFAYEEMYNPKRTLQSTVKTIFKDFERLPVKTAGAIPKDLIFDAMDIIKNIKVSSPVKMGDIIVKNILNTGVDLVASASICTRLGESTLLNGCNIL